MTSAKRYIGITGIVTHADVDTIAACAALLPPDIRLMAGVLVSSKTLTGEPTESRRYPTLTEAMYLLSGLSDFAWPVVHYNTRATGLDLRMEIMELLAFLPEARGIQLNVAAPNPDMVARAMLDHPDVELILQVNRASVPSGLVSDVHAYVAKYSAQHALLDRSGGTGKSLDVSWMAAVLPGLAAWARPAVAGGLGPDSGPVVASLPGGLFSVDAESRSRVPVSDPIDGAKHQDRLDRDLALRYTQAMVDAMTSRG